MQTIHGNDIGENDIRENDIGENGIEEVAPRSRRAVGPIRRLGVSAAIAGLACTLGVAGIAGVAGAGVAGTTAAKPAASGSTQGIVVSIDRSGDSFVIRLSSGTRVTVKVTSATTYDETGVTKPSFSDVAFGDSVAVIGTTSSGVETAAVVIIGHKFSGGGGGFGGGGFGRGGAFGKVTSVDSSADTFQVKNTFNGSTITVKVTSKTTYRDSSVKNAGFSDIKVGENVAVQGSTSNGVETATAVIIGLTARGGFGGAGGFGGHGGTFGKVTSVDSSADTFQLKTSSGSTVTVKVTSKTTYRDSKVKNAGFSDIKVGESVAVIGSTSNGVETATSVVIGFAGFRPPGSGSGPTSGS
jgi:preprotein translocase subunit YajC